METFARQDIFSTGKRGTWYRAETDGKRTAKAICPGCGVIASLEDHSIDDSGRVEPSVQCDCGYHQYIFLAGWGEPDRTGPGA